MSDLQPNADDDDGAATHRRENIVKYSAIIERYLENEMVSLSESDIAKEVLKAALDTNDDIPSSTKDLEKLTEIRESLRMLVSQRKIFQSLVQDPYTKEETAYYTFRRQAIDV
jgi:hypothetical protein